MGQVVDKVSEITKNSESGADVVGAVLEVDGIVVVEQVGRKRTVVAVVTYTVAVEIVAVETVAVEIVAVEIGAVEIGAAVASVAVVASVTAETVEPVAVNNHFER